VVASGPGVAVATIQPQVVSNSKLANMASGRFKARITAGPGDPEDITGTQATTLLDGFVGDGGSGGTKGLVPAPASGDATKFLKGDATWGTPVDTGITTLNTLTATTQTFATGTSGSDFAINSSTATHTFNLPIASATNTGKLSNTDWSTFNAKQPAGNYITALTSDVTASGPGSVPATIAADAVTNTKLANMAQSTIKGRAVGAGTGDPTDLSSAQATAILDTMTGGGGTGLKGLAPAQVAGDVNKFLKGDATWGAVDLSTANVTGVLPMANGGTNKNMTASAGAVAYSDADSLELSAVGSSGQLFQSTGTTAPGWTTATYPSTGGASGTILRSNGTNWVNTTATYPTTTTANRILYSSSANVIGEITSGATSALVTNSSSVPAFTSGSTANRLLRTDGTTVSFAQAALGTDVSGTLPIANGGTNNSSAYTAGSVIFSDGSKLTQDNSNFFWDDANNVLGLGTASPNTSSKLHVNGQSYLDGSVLINRGGGSGTVQIFDNSTPLAYFVATPGTQSVNVGDGVYAIGPHFSVSNTTDYTKQMFQVLKSFTNPAGTVNTTDTLLSHGMSLSAGAKTDSADQNVLRASYTATGGSVLTASGNLQKNEIFVTNTAGTIDTTNWNFFYALRWLTPGGVFTPISEYDLSVTGATRNHYAGVATVTLGAPDSWVVAFGTDHALPDTNYAVTATGSRVAYVVLDVGHLVVGTGWIHVKAVIDDSTKATTGFTGYLEDQVVDGITFKEWGAYNQFAAMNADIITHYAGGRTVTYTDTDYLKVNWIVRRYY
jgi:hypothetical protein